MLLVQPDHLTLREILNKEIMRQKMELFWTEYIELEMFGSTKLSVDLIFFDEFKLKPNQTGILIPRFFQANRMIRFESPAFIRLIFAHPLVAGLKTIESQQI